MQIEYRERVSYNSGTELDPNYQARGDEGKAAGEGKEEE